MAFGTNPPRAAPIHVAAFAKLMGGEASYVYDKMVWAVLWREGGQTKYKYFEE